MGVILSYFATTEPVNHRHRPVMNDDLEERENYWWDVLGCFPGKRPTTDKNILFFENRIPFEPDGICIDLLHSKWYDDYRTLEARHDYIQWLFPLCEKGVNAKAQRLYVEEIEFIRNSNAAQARLFKSYEMMLKFYGFRLQDETSGELERTDEYQDRFNNLNRSSHNNLRITRILKSLRLLGQERFTAPFVRSLVTEIFKYKTLTRARDSCIKFWIPTLEDNEQIEIQDYMDGLVSAEEENTRPRSSSGGATRGTHSARVENTAGERSHNSDLTSHDYHETARVENTGHEAAMAKRETTSDKASARKSDGPGEECVAGKQQSLDNNIGGVKLQSTGNESTETGVDDILVDFSGIYRA